ncbi:MAG: molybdenum ABC transporter ATP-binding protein [Candidatus Krumholzibacteria bacterium]|nr:molybdenum ABC transporter ATP-binding protein [Candidatus Krumholzibacteria bacterium]
MSIKIKCRLDRGVGTNGDPGFRLDVDLDLPVAGITAVFGPSGCGKSTLLRCVAGLEKKARGMVKIGPRVWQDDHTFLPVHQRALGFVFQDGLLFPHLSVLENLEYGLKRSDADRQTIVMDEVVELLGLEKLLARGTTDLSGGERQRVALGRALLTSPDLLLLDEPLAALDRSSRRAIYPYLERLRTDFTLPVLYVTHALDEAARLADHMVLLEGGQAVNSGPLTEMLTSPAPGLAHGDEAGAVLPAWVAGFDREFHLARLGFEGGELLVADTGLVPDQEVRVRIHARDVSLTLEPAGGSSILNILPARVLALIPDSPARVLVRLAVGDSVILAAITHRSATALGLEVGRDVHAQIKSVALL